MNEMMTQDIEYMNVRKFETSSICYLKEGVKSEEQFYDRSASLLFIPMALDISFQKQSDIYNQYM